MTAGLNIEVNIIKITYAADDAVGGAVTTGTVVSANLPAQLVPQLPSQRMLEQGLETETVYKFTANVTKNKLAIDVEERYEVQIVKPLNHPLFGKKFRVTGVNPGRRRSKYGALHMTLSRIRESRRNVYP